MNKNIDNRIIVISDSIKGERRPSNQDGTLAIETEKYHLFFLFDGVSSISTSIDFINDCKKYIKENHIRYFEKYDIGLADLLYQTNKSVIREGSYGMSTCSAVYIDKKNLDVFGANIGDSRIYEYTNQFLEQVTVDDLLPGTTNVLTKSLGDMRLKFADFTQKKISFEYGLLICSDGFYRVMEKQKMRYFSIIHFKRASDIKKAIKSEMMGNNQDDSTYIIIRKNGIPDRK